MAISPENIQVGRCYLGESGQVRRVVRIWQDNRVQYEFRPGFIGHAKNWKPGMLLLREFAASVQRQVPCGWLPGTDEV